MIVNGTEQFVGSNRSKARKNIEAALSESSQVDIKLTPGTMLNGDSFNLSYSLNEIKDDLVLNFAVVERAILRDIGRGENKGKTLRHDNVVRWFETVELTKLNGEILIEFPSDLVKDNAALIVYAQDSITKKIHGAEGFNFLSEWAGK